MVGLRSAPRSLHNPMIMHGRKNKTTEGLPWQRAGGGGGHFRMEGVSFSSSSSSSVDLLHPRGGVTKFSVAHAF